MNLHFPINIVRRQLYLWRHQRDLFYWQWEYRLVSLNPIKIPTIRLADPIDHRDLPKVEIVIPWYGDQNIYRLLKQINLTSDGLVSRVVIRVVIINDAYPDKKKSDELESFTKKFKGLPIKLIVLPMNGGFVKSVNAGLRVTTQDVVILNSDTIPQPGWLAAMLSVAESDEKVATVTAISNNATIFSWPKLNVSNQDHSPAATAWQMARLAPQDSILAPTGHGFCMLIKRRYLERHGILDEKAFGRGYGEENDLCQRFRRRGLKNAVSLKSYVLHLESQSFGQQERRKLIAANHFKLLARYPNYDAQIRRFMSLNPLADFRSLYLSFSNRRSWLENPSILVVVHNNPFTVIGGVERETINLLRHLSAKYQAQQTLVYFFDDKSGSRSLGIFRSGRLVKLLRFRPDTAPDQSLRWILQAFSVQLTIIEHLIGHSLSYGRMLRQAKVRAFLLVHDFYYFCQIPDLINSSGKFCHYELDLDVCRDCLTKKMIGSLPQNVWRSECRKMLDQDFEAIIFNSEFTKNQYLDLYQLKDRSKFEVSYPGEGGKK